MHVILHVIIQTLVDLETDFGLRAFDLDSSLSVHGHGKLSYL